MTHSEQHKMWWSKDGRGTTLKKPARTIEERGGKGANESMVAQAHQKKEGEQRSGASGGGASAASEASEGERREEREAESGGKERGGNRGK